MALEFTTSYLADTRTLFAQYKKLGEAAMAQAKDSDLPRMLDVESNSIVLIVKHMAGNMRSRWTNFLTEDGEKPDRNRDLEFEVQDLTRTELMALWETGWKHLFDALEPLTDDDLSRVVMIRGEKHSVMQAINRQLAHYSSHVGQIIFLAKHWQSADWKSLSVPRGKSAEFNRQVRGGEKGQR
jgi:hypothetical protein